MNYYFGITLLIIGCAAVIISCFASIFWFGGLLLPLIYGGAPFVPTSKKTMAQMIRLAELKNTDHVVDMGSGDGRLLISAIEAGASSAEGYEIHPGLVWFSRQKVKAKKLKDKVIIHRKSYWDADLSKTTVVLLYQIPDSMKRLSDKLLSELPLSARVISHAFPFPESDWKPIKQEGKIYVYQKTG